MPQGLFCEFEEFFRIVVYGRTKGQYILAIFLNNDIVVSNHQKKRKNNMLRNGKL